MNHKNYYKLIALIVLLFILQFISEGNAEAFPYIMLAVIGHFFFWKKIRTFFDKLIDKIP